MKKVFVLWWLLFGSSSILAEVVDIDHSKGHFDTHFLLYVDSNACYDYKSISLKPDTDFHVLSASERKVKFTEAALWLRVYLENKSSKDQVRYLRLNDFLINSFELFTKDSYYQSGTLHNKEDRYSRPTAKIVVPHNSIIQIDIRLHSTTSPIKFEFVLEDEDTMDTLETQYKLIEGLLFGFLMALLIYNATIFTFIKEMSYLYYVFYISALIFHHLRYSGIGQLYVYPNSPNFATYSGAPAMSLLLIATLLFTRSFFQMQRYKIVNTIYLYSIAILTILGLLMLYPPLYSGKVMMFFAMLTGLMMLMSLISVIKKGGLEAKVYFFGWLPILIVLVTMAYKKIFGSIGIETIPYIAEGTMAFEAILFSIALAMRIRRLQLEKFQVSEDFIRYQSQIQEELEVEVDTRTKALQQSLHEREILLREVNHRVKNNMQIIISMLRLQADRYDKEVKDIVTVAENRIRSMLSIHELLYKSEDLSQVNTKIYIQTLLEEITRSFSFDDKKIKVSITDDDLCVDILVQAGFIINELVTNAIKYAKNDQGVLIHVDLNVDQGELLLIVSDNGLPLSVPSQEGLGTLFVRTIVEDQLLGSLHIEKGQGYKVEVRFPLGR